ncbi:bifunctional phosphoribosylaminoimidazolecarboxamide formyltransferase/IMP cyclohydrolase [Clostridium tetani]|uniref:Bifunctional purine biosynthesis protein PurH n=1 Tax=Clostridium tetani TaxID=1513 RepID=A0ABC8EDI8_CLOTA|nr:bifunctional phosphoribosylaminoimidazolecarboxamide formyltransferase/IMP cyclohydrolase [Clostridium tetani]AVP55304.1 bifunctional phosphoribosylaminoimidazolecarboxamide formyltransferase/IMP cyclohydrolase PurH [Clostridium tetani]KGI44807.1 phosphoribosylaminoimidazolecarboxamide formyltransferase [Clostridium tetani]RXI73875.1 bifunctional phosphoribosylaminoimidazolecarboxamide formyltransferase/IMP cyclohydrolase PurH [Clostridium tetani]BDR76180.1 bifunctional purine biosynthesis p
MIKRALISVYNKEGILEFAKFLEKNHVEIISTGGTYKHLKDNCVRVKEVSQITNFDEILDGRVKTLHPAVHGGILAIRDNKEHMDTIKDRNIEPIDMVIVNLYPFFEKAGKGLSLEEQIEFIDIGGPTMIRAAAKNFKDVVVITDPKDYKRIEGKLKKEEEIDFNTRKTLAGKVFNLMSAYDGAISKFLLEEEYPEYLSLSYKKDKNLRYGENPHQSAAFYTSLTEDGVFKDFEKLNGKELSYNNIKDMDIALKVVAEFEEIACCALKHNSPCGVAIGNTLVEAYKKTYECDPISIFGGIVAFNRKLDKETSKELVKIFLEIIIAPDYDEDALEILKGKKNLRIIKCNTKPSDKMEVSKVDGGILVQSTDNILIKDMNIVTSKNPTEEEMENMIFAMKVVKYVKSNAIVVAKDKKAVGIAGGQVNRIWAACQALERGNDPIVLASDAFFPFNDVVKKVSEYGVKAIIQPGGSIRDKDSIEECDKNRISMVLTGIRHFKH